jgi:hypothetical protein
MAQSLDTSRSLPPFQLKLIVLILYRQQRREQSTLQNLYNFTSERHKIFTSVDYLKRKTGEAISRQQQCAKEYLK